MPERCPRLSETHDWLSQEQCVQPHPSLHLSRSESTVRVGRSPSKRERKRYGYRRNSLVSSKRSSSGVTPAVRLRVPPLLSAPPAYAAKYITDPVNAPTAAGDCLCTLRQAILAARNDSSYDSACGAVNDSRNTIAFSGAAAIVHGSTLPNIVGVGIGR